MAQNASNDMDDLIVVGAGTAGLASAIMAARRGLSVTLFEQSAQPGPHPRGETLRSHPVLDALVGEGFMDEIAVHRTALRRYHSPGGLKHFDLVRKSPSHVFRWRDLVDHLAALAVNAGVKIQYNTHINGPIYEEERCVGVHTDGGRHTARAVIACDGHDSMVGRSLGIRYDAINCPTVKCLIQSPNTTYEGFEFFFVANGDLPDHPWAPPMVAFVFPRGTDGAEVGLMVFPETVDLIPGCRIPSEPELLEIWTWIKGNLPLFSRVLEGATIVHEEPTLIPNAGLVPVAMQRPGLVLLGDAVGFIEASGASGIVAGVRAADFWTSALAEVSQAGGHWTTDLAKEWNLAFMRTDIYKHIAKVYKLAGGFKRIVFGRWLSAAKINRRWGIVSRVYRLT